MVNVINSDIITVFHNEIFHYYSEIINGNIVKCIHYEIVICICYMFVCKYSLVRLCECTPRALCTVTCIATWPKSKRHNREYGARNSAMLTMQGE